MPAQILPAIDYSRNQLVQQQLQMDQRKSEQDFQMNQLKMQHEQTIFQQQQQLAPLQKAIMQAELSKNQQAGQNMKAEFDQQALSAPDVARRTKSFADSAESDAGIKKAELADTPGRLQRNALSEGLSNDRAKAQTAQANATTTREIALTQSDSEEAVRKMLLFPTQFAAAKAAADHMSGQVKDQALGQATKEGTLIASIPMLPKGAARIPALEYAKARGVSQQQLDELRDSPELGEAFKATVAKHGPELSAYYDTALRKMERGYEWVDQPKMDMFGEPLMVKDAKGVETPVMTSVKKDTTMEGYLMVAKVTQAMTALDKAKQAFVLPVPLDANGKADSTKMTPNAVYRFPSGMTGTWNGKTVDPIIGDK